MDDDLQDIALFPLTIELDEDDPGWSHLIGLGCRTTVQELPAPLQERARRAIAFLHERGIVHLAIQVRIFPLCLYNGVRQALPEGGPDDLTQTLRLMSWWMEWSHRRVVAHFSWRCPECNGEVKPKHGICDQPSCASWNVLHLITGEPILHLVPSRKTGTHDAS